LTSVKTKFLLADDDADDTSMFCEALNKVASPAKCYTVENGRQVFEFLSGSRAEKPDVIFLDINMPVMNGWECLKKLKSNPDFGTIPAIMYSTSSAKKDIETAYSLGASLFMTKPDNFDELCKILKVIASTPHESLKSQLKSFPNVKVDVR
jgi:CheY-like chemotaxis protein